VPLLGEASRLAVTAGADALAVEAWGRRAWAAGTGDDPAGALAGLDVTEALAARPRATRYARAILYSDVGSVELARDRRVEARAAFERALLESRGVGGAAAVELVSVRSNLALVTDDPRARDALIADSAAELTRLLGADHPKTLRQRRMRGTVTVVELTAALEVLTPACAGFELHRALKGGAVPCWAEVAFVRRELGDAAGAVAAIDRALTIGGAPLADQPELQPYRTLWRGDVESAVAAFSTALAALPVRAGEPWWVRGKRAELQLGLGRALRAAGRPAAARAALEPSVTELALVARNHPVESVERRLGRARADLALALAASGGPPARAQALATQAAARLRRAGGRADEIATLEALVGKLE
jgi:tetratricopeptide (TPR) repeat protein